MIFYFCVKLLLEIMLKGNVLGWIHTHINKDRFGCEPIEMRELGDSEDYKGLPKYFTKGILKSTLLIWYSPFLRHSYLIISEDGEMTKLIGYWPRGLGPTWEEEGWYSYNELETKKEEDTWRFLGGGTRWYDGWSFLEIGMDWIWWLEGHAES